VDAIIHLAGESVAQRWSARSKRSIKDSRVDRTRALVEAIGKLKHKPAVLVSASAVGYYGERGAEVLTEQSGRGSGFLADLCVSWETEAIRAREFGLRVVPVRLATVLGPGGGALKPMLPLFRAGLGGRLGSGLQWMSWIHLQDVVNLLLFAAGNEHITGVLNACSPEPVQNIEFTRQLARVVHRPAILPVPLFGLKLILGEVAGYIVASARVMPEEPLRHSFEFSYPALEGCLEALVASPGHTSMSASSAS
jgi:uncharacterized protein